VEESGGHDPDNDVGEKTGSKNKKQKSNGGKNRRRTKKGISYLWSISLPEASWIKRQRGGEKQGGRRQRDFWKDAGHWATPKRF